MKKSALSHACLCLLQFGKDACDRRMYWSVDKCDKVQSFYQDFELEEIYIEFCNKDNIRMEAQ